jgi:hypothetical protein
VVDSTALQSSSISRSDEARVSDSAGHLGRPGLLHPTLLVLQHQPKQQEHDLGKNDNMTLSPMAKLPNALPHYRGWVWDLKLQFLLIIGHS